MKDVAAWIGGCVPPNEDLERAELAALARALAEERRLWERFVRHVPNERYFVELYRDVHLDVWLICWLNQQDTGFHDHDVSAGAVCVCDGTLVEERLKGDERSLRMHARAHEAGGAFDFHASYVHRMRHPGGGPATSIHCYSPALWRLGHYDFDEEGTFCRTSVTYADEMWAGRAAETRSFEPS